MLWRNSHPEVPKRLHEVFKINTALKGEKKYCEHKPFILKD